MNKLLKKNAEEATPENATDPIQAHFDERKDILIKERERLSRLIVEADTTIKHIDGALGELRLARDAILGKADQ